MTRNEALTHAMTRPNRELTVLSGRSQAPKATSCTIPFTRNTQNRQIHRDRNQTGSCQGLEGEGMGRDNVVGTKFYLGSDENVLELDVVAVQGRERPKCHLIVH